MHVKELEGSGGCSPGVEVGGQSCAIHVGEIGPAEVVGEEE